MDKKIERFADQMQIELIKNENKGSVYEWKGLRDKLIDLEYHKAKMLLAIKEKNDYALKEYIADCANILLSIGDELKLYDYDSILDDHVSQMKKDIFEIIPIEQQVIRTLI